MVREGISLTLKEFKKTASQKIGRLVPSFYPALKFSAGYHKAVGEPRTKI
jgi:hypothetical protein